MIWLTEKEDINCRLGKVGSVQCFDPWQSRMSHGDMKRYVADIASLSYGNESAKNPDVLHSRIMRDEHLSCLEFIPWARNGLEALPIASFRSWHRTLGSNDIDEAFTVGEALYGTTSDKALGVIVECPIFVARQWMRHRSFAYLEMSRRYTLESKVPAQFYGDSYLNDVCVQEYERLLAAGEPPELARRVLPVGMMTKFYCAGFLTDWKHFIGLRSDAHAQLEIRVFSDHISNVIDNTFVSV